MPGVHRPRAIAGRWIPCGAKRRYSRRSSTYPWGAFRLTEALSRSETVGSSPSVRSDASSVDQDRDPQGSARRSNGGPKSPVAERRGNGGDNVRGEPGLEVAQLTSDTRHSWPGQELSPFGPG